MAMSENCQDYNYFSCLLAPHGLASSNLAELALTEKSHSGAGWAGIMI